MRPPRLALLALALAAASPCLGQAPRPPAKYVPAEDLAAFVQLDGLDAHRAAWGRTAAHGILHDTTTGAMLRSLLAQLFDAVDSQARRSPVNGDEFAAVLEHVADRGMALGVYGPLGDGPPVLVAVFPGAAGGKVKDPAERIVRSLTADAPTQVLTRQDGRRLTVVRGGGDGQGWAFWSEGDDLVIAAGRSEFGADPVIAALEGKAKSAADDPLLAELARAEGGFEPVLVGWFDGSALPKTPPALGLDGLKRVDYRVGFQAEALVSVTRVVAPSPRKGVLAMLDGPAITAQGFPPLPAGLTDYTVASIDLAKAYDTFAAIARDSDPNGDATVKGVEGAFQQLTGVELRGGLLAALGPKWAFYTRPEPIRSSLTPFGAAADYVFHLPPVVLQAELKDPGTFAATLDKLVQAGNTHMAALGGSEGDTLRFEPLKPPARGYRLVVPPRIAPLPTSLKPGLAIRGNTLAFTTNLAALADGPALAPPADLPAGAVFYSVQDPRDLMPDLVANLPFLVHLAGRLGPGGPFGPPDPERNPIARVAIDPDLVPDPAAIRARLFPGVTSLAVDDQGLTFRTRDAFPSLSPASAGPVAAALILPAVQSARQAARRAQSTNNLKQIMLALHNYHSVNGQFPPAAICDKDGKPLLSWRVAILPYIEQQALYNEFHLDEAWDSPHNKPLSETLVQVYAPLQGDAVGTNMTYYQGLVGNGAFFEECEAAKIQDITDGTSNTIAVIEAARPVPWAKPEDVPFDPDKDPPRLGGLGFAGGYNAAFADGSVHFLKETIDPETLKALFTRAGGEVISADSF
jgi:hypothetical protein